MFQDDPFGKSGLADVEATLKRRNLPLIASVGYKKNTDNVTEAVKTLAGTLSQAVIMISAKMTLSGRRLATLATPFACAPLPRALSSYPLAYSQQAWDLDPALPR